MTVLRLLNAAMAIPRLLLCTSAMVSTEALLSIAVVRVVAVVVRRLMAVAVAMLP